MVEELEYVSRVCFLKTIPSINCFRSYCGYAPLKPEECPEDVSSMVAWLADVKEDKTKKLRLSLYLAYCPRLVLSHSINLI